MKGILGLIALLIVTVAFLLKVFNINMETFVPLMASYTFGVIIALCVVYKSKNNTKM